MFEVSSCGLLFSPDRLLVIATDDSQLFGLGARRPLHTPLDVLLDLLLNNIHHYLGHLKVIKQGLSALGDDDALFSLGFDDVMDTLDSCHVLHELDMPELEIKYQCSCYDFWHYYKCRHSLAMSIMKDLVEVPKKYKIKNIGSTRIRGRPSEAHGGEALGEAAKKKKKKK